MKKDKKSGPQIENGHIDIANELVEALAKTNLYGCESQVLWALWRMTWGYVEKDGKGRLVYGVNKKGNRQPIKKKFARITSKKWVELTGLDKSNIYKVLRRLCRRNIVIKIGNEYKSVTWGFQKHYKQWVKEGFGVQRDNKNNGVQRDHQLVSTGTPVGVHRYTKIITKPLQDNAVLDAKENSLKKTYIKKEKEDIYFDDSGEEKKIFNYWNSLDIFEHKTFRFFANDIREALKNYSLEEIKDSIKNYSLILKGEEYYYSHEHTISSFLEPKNFEKFKDLKKAKKNFLIRKINNQFDDGEYNIPKYEPEKKEEKTKEEIIAERKKISKLAGEVANKLRRGVD